MRRWKSRTCRRKCSDNVWLPSMTLTGPRRLGDEILVIPTFVKPSEVTTLAEYGKKSFGEAQGYSLCRQHGGKPYPIQLAIQMLEHTSTKTILILRYPLEHLPSTSSSSTKLKPSQSARMSNFRHFSNESTTCTTRKRSETSTESP